MWGERGVEHPDGEDSLSQTVGRHTHGSGTGVHASQHVSELIMWYVSKTCSSVLDLQHPAVWAVCQGAAQCGSGTAAGREVPPGELSPSAGRIPDEWPCWAHAWLVLWLASHYRKLSYWLSELSWVALLAKWWQRESEQWDFMCKAVGSIPGIDSTSGTTDVGQSFQSGLEWKTNYAGNILEYVCMSKV